MSETVQDAPIRPPAGFVARCLTCKYDLRGLPDGVCPECGEAFTHAGLVEWARGPKGVQIPERWLLLGIAVVSNLCPPFASEVIRNAPGITLIWTSVTWFCVICWLLIRDGERKKSTKWYHFAWLLLPAADSVLAAFIVGGTAAIVGVGWCLGTIDAALHRRRWMQFLMATCGSSIGLLLGGWMFVDSLCDMRVGYRASDWNLSVNAMPVTPPTPQQAFVVAAFILTVGVLFLIARVILADLMRIGRRAGC